MIFPEPTNYTDWREWARDIIFANTFARKEITPLELVRYEYSALPKPDTDGLVVWCVDNTSGPGIVYSQGGSWYDLSGNLVEQGTVLYAPKVHYTLEYFAPTLTIA